MISPSREETSCQALIATLARARRHKFALKRPVILTVLHRLFVSRSDRSTDRWREDSPIAAVAGIDFHWATVRLGEELPAKEAAPLGYDRCFLHVL